MLQQFYCAQSRCAATLRAYFMSLALCAICSLPLAAPLRRLQMPCMTGIGRRHMSSAAPASPAAAAPVADSSPSQLPSERILFVQPKGAKDWAALKATSDTIVGMLKTDIKKELELDARLQDITLQLAAKNAAGEDQLVPLDSMDTIAEALAKAFNACTVLGIMPEEKLRIIVDVAAPAKPMARALSPTPHRPFLPRVVPKSLSQLLPAICRIPLATACSRRGRHAVAGGVAWAGGL